MNSTKKANTILTARVIDALHLGFTVVGFPERILDLSKVHSDNRAYAEMHGWGQRIPDKAAIPTTDKDENLIPAEERLRRKDAGIQTLIAHYESGAAGWTMAGRSASVRTETDHTLTLAAIGALHGMDFAAVNVFINAKATALSVSRQAVLDSFAGLPRYAERVAQLRAERVASAGINADSLLDGLPVAE